MTLGQHTIDGTLYTSHYKYDSLSREVATWRDEQGNKGERFGYNAIGQLTSASYNADQVWTGNPQNATLNQTYDVTSLNRNAVWNNGQATSYSFNALNQYTAVNGEALNYDGAFNLAVGPGGFSASYDAEGHLLSATNGGNSAQFVYDGLGRCVKRTINGVTRFITYDNWNPIYEWDAAGNAVGANFYGAKADELIGRWDSSLGFLFYKQDKRGNVVMVLDGGGTVQEKYSYDAFGKPKIMDSAGNERTQSAIGNRFMFQGREWISELGIYDFRNRMYHPQLGRFLQKDPLGFDAGDANLFRYCGGDPVNFNDPSGEFFVPAAWVVGVLITAIITNELYHASHRTPAVHPGHPQALPPHTEWERRRGGEPRPGYSVKWLWFTASAPTQGTLFGVGASTGQHYFNSGAGWLPVGQAPVDVRWAPNSGTGNYTASQFTHYAQGNWGMYGSNDTGTTGDAGHTIYYPNVGTPMGRLDPEEGVVMPSDVTFCGSQRDPRWVFPSQAESARLELSYVGNTQKYNDWLIAHNQWYYGGK